MVEGPDFVGAEDIAPSACWIKVCLEIKVGWLVIVLLITFSWAVNAVLAAHIFLNKKKKNCILATDCSF
ncbi:hypothetical protein AgCh_002470 [Apium graveolens]